MFRCYKIASSLFSHFSENLKHFQYLLYIFYEIENERIRLQSSWTLLGITLPEKKNTGKKVTLSKRMKDLAESHRHKILVFRNGESAEGIEIVANRFDGVIYFD